MSGGFEDWDHINGTAELDATKYTSSPSSLKRMGAASVMGFSLTKAAAAQSLADGMVVSQARNEGHYGYISFVFRYQDEDNYYFITISTYSNSWTLRRVEAGVPTIIGNRDTTFDVLNETWYKWRCTFWTSEGHIWVRLEYWDGESWIKQGDDIADVNNEWPTGGRVGVMLWRDTEGGDLSVWFDDTEIWG